MVPTLEKTSFGQITIDGKLYRHDILIRLDGSIEKRAKKLSKQVYGTSHKISLAEAEHIFQAGADLLVVGTGQYGLVELSPEASQFFEDRELEVLMRPTPQALDVWNKAGVDKIGVFHLTC